MIAETKMESTALEQLLNDRSKNWWFGGFVSIPLNELVVVLYQQTVGKPETVDIAGHAFDGLMPVTINQTLPYLEIQFEGVVGFQSIIESFYGSDKSEKRADAEPSQYQYPLYNVFTNSKYLAYISSIENGTLSLFDNDNRVYQIITADHIIEVVTATPPTYKWVNDEKTSLVQLR